MDTTGRLPLGSMAFASAPIKEEPITDHDQIMDEDTSVDFDIDSSVHPSFVVISTYSSEEDEESSKESVPKETENDNSDVGGPKKLSYDKERKMNKKLRMAGKSYVGKKKSEAGNWEDRVKPSRSMGKPCVSKACAKAKTRMCNEISEKTRSRLFQTFWEKLDWSHRKVYIRSLVQVEAQKHRCKKSDSSSRRAVTMTYFLRVGNKKKPVCKSLFLSTFGLKETCVRDWILSANDGTHDKSKKCEMPSKKRLRFSEESLTHATAYLDNLPKIPSHYCQPSSNKSFLEPVILSKLELYRMYNEKCVEDAFLTPVSVSKFLELFETKNLSIFQRKDQCDTCCSYKAGNLSEDDFKIHQTRKLEAGEERRLDVERADGLFSGAVLCFCMDMQSVRLSPMLKASAMHYKAKLCVHNFTFYNMTDKSVHCYWWSEIEGRLVESVFASIVTDFISKQITADCEEFVIYSDGCTHQNRNAVMSNALLRLAKEKKIEITQKFLECVHTQLEFDGAHSIIEHKLKNRDVYLPSDYVKICKEACVSKLYTADYIDHKFFSDFTGLHYYQSICPGSEVGGPTVTDVVAFKYSSGGEMHFKLRFTDEWNPMPRRPKAGNYAVCPLYTSQQKITKEKYEQLQDMKSLIPSDCRSFYDNLPHV